MPAQSHQVDAWGYVASLTGRVQPAQLSSISILVRVTVWRLIEYYYSRWMHPHSDFGHHQVWHQTGTWHHTPIDPIAKWTLPSSVRTATNKIEARHLAASSLGLHKHVPGADIPYKSIWHANGLAQVQTRESTASCEACSTKEYQ